jgi:hypothetical protein
VAKGIDQIRTTPRRCDHPKTVSLRTNRLQLAPNSSRVNSLNRNTHIVCIRAANECGGRLGFDLCKYNSNFTLERELETQGTQKQQGWYLIDFVVVRKCTKP